MSNVGCGRHDVCIVDPRNGAIIGELADILQVRWDRRRDDISEAQITMAEGCCEVMAGVRTIIHEVWIYRDGVRVWRGLVTRLEFDFDEVRLYAEDMLWPAKRRAVEQGWNYEKLPSGGAPDGVQWARDFLLLGQCYAKYGDYWRMSGDVQAHTHVNDFQVRTAVNKYQFYVWQVLDDMARYADLDYTCVNGTIHLFDSHLNWNPIPMLLPEHIGRWPRIVEYGNQFGNRYIRTDGSGYGGTAVAPQFWIDYYGKYVDILSNATNLDEEVPTEVPSAALLKAWQENANRNISKHYPPPVSIVVPEGSTLMPASPWDVNTLMPGSWFQVTVEHSCRTVTDIHKLQEVQVVDSGDDGEEVTISTLTAPKDQWLP